MQSLESSTITPQSYVQENTEKKTFSRPIVNVPQFAAQHHDKYVNIFNKWKS